MVLGSQGTGCRPSALLGLHLWGHWEQAEARGPGQELLLIPGALMGREPSVPGLQEVRLPSPTLL